MTALSAGEISESDSWQMLRSSQREFARLIGVSVGYVNRLAAMGVLILNPQKQVMTLESFRRFWEWYLAPWRQQELIDGATNGVMTSRRRQSSILFNCRDLREEILAAEMELSTRQIFRLQRRGLEILGAHNKKK